MKSPADDLHGSRNDSLWYIDSEGSNCMEA
jgi:hypothetical protein